MSIFVHPTGLTVVAHFRIPSVQTWGGRNDAAYKLQVREVSGVNATMGSRYAWFVFCIRCVVGQGRSTRRGQVPDIENIPKLIVDAFTGILYPDDNLNFVRGVQVEAEWGPDAAEQAEVWILGQPK